MKAFKTTTCLNAAVLMRSAYTCFLKRSIHIPCRTTENKTVNWSSSNLSTTQKHITENIRLISLHDNSSKLQPTTGKPLAVILEWLMAKEKHIWKFFDIYLNHGFDVMSVKLKPGQLIWPVKGSQIVAGELLAILFENHSHKPIVIHGFSVGGYLWGEVQVKMAQDIEKYKPLINDISGTIWDSAVDINEIVIGVPAALFPNNALLRNACRKYILYHMKAFEKEATQHWRKSREMFYCPIVKCPSLLLYSKSDPAGNTNSYKNVKKSYESLGIQIYEKCWEKSPHVAHYAFHREEYIHQMEMFLENIGVLDSVSHKRAAAL